MRTPLTHYGTFLSAYLKSQRRRVLLLILLLFGILALELANPLILREFIDSALAGEPLSGLFVLAAMFLGVAITMQLVSVAETYVAENVGLTATNRLRSDLTLHALKLDPSFHSAYTPGELIERVDGDVATLGNFFSRFVVHLLGNAILMVGVLVMLFSIDWRVGLSLTLFTLAALALVNRLRDFAVPHWKLARQSKADLFGFLEERLSATEDLRSSGATDHAMRKLYERSREVLRRERRAALIGTTSGSVTIVLFTMATAVALALGVSLFQAGAISLGTVYLIFSFTEALRRPIDQITRQLQDLQQAGASISRVSDLLQMRSSIVDGTGPDIPSGALTVEFEGVTFGYNPDEPVLRDVSFSLQPGTILGVLGRTGSGKTTLTRLLFRLYDPVEGAIRLGGVDLRDTRLAGVRRSVGMVTQDIHLFNASLRDNLTFFDKSIPDAAILEVLDDLGLGEWYGLLPNGLDTIFAPGGSGISAGQAQLVAFARVFLKDPGLVILDEASSRLDPATERQVERAVDKLLRGRTAIIIAHRLGTVQRADNILIFEGGCVVEYGERKMLAADPHSSFARLTRTGLEDLLA